MAAITAPTGLRPVDPAQCIILRKKAAATTITAGEAVYVSANDTVAIADKDTAANAQALGIALQTPVAAGDYIDVCLYGELTGYSKLTAGNTVWVFDDGALTVTHDGGGAENGDIVSGDYATQIGLVINASTILVCPVRSRVVVKENVNGLVALQGAVTDSTAGVTATTFFTYDLPAGVSATVVDVGFSARAVGVAAGTIDVFEAGTTILTGAITAAAGEVKGVIADAAIAAGATITAKYTTGASTGSITDGVLTILLRLAEA